MPSLLHTRRDNVITLQTSLFYTLKPLISPLMTHIPSYPYTIRIVFVAVAALQNKVIPLRVRCPRILTFLQSHDTNETGKKMSTVHYRRYGERSHRSENSGFAVRQTVIGLSTLRDACLAPRVDDYCHASHERCHSPR